MDIKLVVLDIDGTLLTTGGELAPRVRRAIRDVREKGIAVVLATGRRLCRTMPWVRALGLTDPVIAHNGAVIVHPEDERVLVKRVLPLDIAQRLVEQLGQLRVQYCLYDGAFAGDEVFVEREFWQASRGVFRQFLADAADPVDAIAFHHPPVKISVLDETERLSPLLPIWRQEFGADTTMLVFESRDYLGVEFMAFGCSKASGVEFVLNESGLAFSQVLAMGDDVNDIELLDRAGMGFAMANSPQEVREGARFVAPSNDDDGVAEVLEEYLLPGGRFFG